MCCPLASSVAFGCGLDGNMQQLSTRKREMLIQVCDGRKLKDTPGASGQETSLLSQGVSEGSTLVLFKRRTPPATSSDSGQISHPTLEHIERVVRAEAERQGREVVTPAQPSENRGIAPLETRLHDIMQV